MDKYNRGSVFDQVHSMLTPSNTTIANLKKSVEKLGNTVAAVSNQTSAAVKKSATCL